MYQTSFFIVIHVQTKDKLTYIPKSLDVVFVKYRMSILIIVKFFNRIR